MKKSLLILMSTITTSVFAQTSSKHEISVGYGIAPVQEFGTLINDGVLMGIAGRKSDHISGSGAINATYRYMINNRFSVGVSGFWSQSKVTYKDPSGKSTWNVFGVMANGKYNYIAKEKFQLYGNAGLGYANYNNKTDNDKSSFGSLAYQVSPIGVYYGKNIGVFCEAGFGYNGILNAGVSYKF
ncbi:outer membrane beta-barrel protein [Empedobacter brevis]|uniref:outer membrane beta-barrel protein n=1 Tax=Empedobacter brevis TaxID=247 RepID=UPI0023EF7F87|nr:outer membrane beta-barrel protein [Empedobacter brevis]